MNVKKASIGPWTLSLFCLVSLCTLDLNADSIPFVLFGGLGGHNNGDSTNDGALATVNPNSGAVSIVGHPTGVSRISGLVFDLSGLLYATTQPAGGFPPPPGPLGVSNLLQLNASNGAILSSVPIRENGIGISIADLALQPSTGLLYGIRAPADQLGGQGKLYTINKTTGAATLVGNTGDFFGSIAFGSNGTLYMSSADLDAQDNFVNIGLKTLNPTNAATLTFIPTFDFFGALAVSPDGVIFAGNGDFGQLFTINSSTGRETLIGSSGRNFIGDLAFEIVPEPATFAFSGMSLILLIGAKRAAQRRR